MKKLVVSSLISLFFLSCSIYAPDNSSTSPFTIHPSLVLDTSSPALLNANSSLNFSDLEKEYKSFSTKALSDAYVSRMFTKFLTTSPNPTQVIRQLEFARYLKDVKSDPSYFNSLKTFINGDSAKFNLINNTIGVSQKKSSEPATFGPFVDSLNPNPINYLLDTYSGAAVAYSLRKLRNAYSGSCIKVRRSSDNTEQNIGFTTGGDIDTTSLGSFVGSGNGFVSVWYDQSGNGNNAIQTVVNNQPQIYDSNGITNYLGNKGIWFDNVSNNKYFNLTYDISGDYPVSSFSTFKKYNSSSLGLALLHNTSVYYGPYTPVDYIDGSVYFTVSNSGGNNRRDAGLGSTNRQILTGIAVNNSNISMYRNGNTLTSSNNNNSTFSGSFNTLGGRPNYSPVYMSGWSQEFILYKSDQTTNRTGLESNINSYFNIF